MYIYPPRAFWRVYYIYNVVAVIELETKEILQMKNKKKKYFDSVQMVREIRDAIFKQANDPKFDPNEFKRIKDKWSKLLEIQELNSGKGIELAK